MPRIVGPTTVAEHHRQRLDERGAHRRPRGRIARREDGLHRAERGVGPPQLEEARDQHRTGDDPQMPLGRHRAGMRERKDAERRGDEREVEDDRARGRRAEASMHLQRRARHRRQADERHVRQHQRGQLVAEPHIADADRRGRDSSEDHRRRARERDGRARHPLREQDRLADDDDAPEQRREQREEKPRVAARLRGVVAVELRVARHERGGDRAFAEEPSEEVRDEEREVERVHQRADAEHARERGVAHETRDPAHEREHRHQARVVFESLGHRIRVRSSPARSSPRACRSTCRARACGARSRA